MNTLKSLLGLAVAYVVVSLIWSTVGTISIANEEPVDVKIERTKQKYESGQLSDVQTLRIKERIVSFDIIQQAQKDDIYNTICNDAYLYNLKVINPGEVKKILPNGDVVRETDNGKFYGSYHEYVAYKRR